MLLELLPFVGAEGGKDGLLDLLQVGTGVGLLGLLPSDDSSPLMGGW